MKVVAIGCGGYLGWNGGFTLFLLDDNRLFYCGNLGYKKNVCTPVQIKSKDLYKRHILSISAGEDWAGVAVSRRVTPEDPTDVYVEEQEVDLASIFSS